MKLIDVEEKHPPFDVASGQAEALLATGKVKKYDTSLKEALTPYHVTTFRVMTGHQVEDYQFPPEIGWTCGHCGPGRISGPNAHKQRIYHVPPHGFVEEIPSDIATQFIAARKAWEKRFGKKAADPDFLGRGTTLSPDPARSIDDMLAAIGIFKRKKS
jgi:hypothetical protein